MRCDRAECRAPVGETRYQHDALRRRGRGGRERDAEYCSARCRDLEARAIGWTPPAPDPPRCTQPDCPICRPEAA